MKINSDFKKRQQLAMEEAMKMYKRAKRQEPKTEEDIFSLPTNDYLKFDIELDENVKDEPIVDSLKNQSYGFIETKMDFNKNIDDSIIDDILFHIDKPNNKHSLDDSDSDIYYINPNDEVAIVKEINVDEDILHKSDITPVFDENDVKLETKNSEITSIYKKRIRVKTKNAIVLDNINNQINKIDDLTRHIKEDIGENSEDTLHNNISSNSSNSNIYVNNVNIHNDFRADTTDKQYTRKVNKSIVNDGETIPDYINDDLNILGDILNSSLNSPTQDKCNIDSIDSISKNNNSPKTIINDTSATLDIFEDTSNTLNSLENVLNDAFDAQIINKIGTTDINEVCEYIGNGKKTMHDGISEILDTFDDVADNTFNGEITNDIGTSDVNEICENIDNGLKPIPDNIDEILATLNDTNDDAPSCQITNDIDTSDINEICEDIDNSIGPMPDNVDEFPNTLDDINDDAPSCEITNDIDTGDTDKVCDDINNRVKTMLDNIDEILDTLDNTPDSISDNIPDDILNNEPTSCVKPLEYVHENITTGDIDEICGDIDDSDKTILGDIDEILDTLDDISDDTLNGKITNNIDINDIDKICKSIDNNDINLFLDIANNKKDTKQNGCNNKQKKHNNDKSNFLINLEKDLQIEYKNTPVIDIDKNTLMDDIEKDINILWNSKKDLSFEFLDIELEYREDDTNAKKK